MVDALLTSFGLAYVGGMAIHPRLDRILPGAALARSYHFSSLCVSKRRTIGPVYPAASLVSNEVYRQRLRALYGVGEAVIEVGRAEEVDTAPGESP